MRIDFERRTLRNGLRVVLSPDRSLPVVAVNLWYRVGSRNEEPGRTGFAHLFEHMMFQGSEHVPDTQHIAHIERMGGSMNGSTWLDRTNYFETVPSHFLERVLWLESDRMGFFLPALTQQKFDTQREVVKNERRWRVDNQPYGDWDERLQALVYPDDHPYHHSVIGSMGDLDAATLDDVRRFFRTHYSPNNAVLTICGDFETADAERLVEHYFGGIPRGEDPPPLPGESDLSPTLDGEVVEEVRGDVALPRIYLAYRIPPFGTDGYLAADLASRILASGKASRLYARLVRDRSIVQDVGAFAFPIVTGAAMLVVRATVSPHASVEEVQAELDRQMVELRGQGPTPEEKERALSGVESGNLLGLQKVGTRADQLSMYTALFDDPDLLNRELDSYRGVTGEDIRHLADGRLRPEHRVRLVYHPKAADPARKEAA